MIFAQKQIYNKKQRTSIIRHKKSYKILYPLQFFAKYNPQIEMFARFKMKSSFHKTKRII